MRAYRIGDGVALIFTKVLDRLRLGLVEEDEEVQEPADRAYWEKRGSRIALGMVDDLFAMIRELDPALTLTYTRFYIGLAKEGRTNNLVILRPRKDWLRFEPRVERSDELKAQLEEGGLDVMEYDSRWGAVPRFVSAETTSRSTRRR